MMLVNKRFDTPNKELISLFANMSTGIHSYVNKTTLVRGHWALNFQGKLLTQLLFTPGASSLLPPSAREKN